MQEKDMLHLNVLLRYHSFFRTLSPGPQCGLAWLLWRFGMGGAVPNTH